ncbi:MAG TPA: serine hydrolase [Candidatus Bathyarchaeia archaeon]|nr:serine hydrolase [Candidatus Bathyarchaeia archaeon]
MKMSFLFLKRVRIFVVVIFFLIEILVPPGAQAYEVSARAAIFSNSTKVVRYYGKNVHTRVLPASTVKVMTALLALERLPLKKVVRASKRASLAQPSKIGVQPGEQFYVRDLIYAILLKSANDAAVVLAEAVSGSEWEFVQLMNKRARELGCKNTHFANPNGLPTKATQYTTPYDMYLIFRAALKQPFFKATIRKKSHSISSLTGRTFHLRSHNKILFFDWKNKLYGKTGYTHGARSCFVGYVTKGNDICIIAVFGCSRRWEDIKYIVSHYGGIPL